MENEPEGTGLYKSYGGRSLHAQSHGESFLALVQSRFRGKGLYILDEPEAALSASRQMTLLSHSAGLPQGRYLCFIPRWPSVPDLLQRYRALLPDQNVPR